MGRRRHRQQRLANQEAYMDRKLDSIADDAGPSLMSAKQLSKKQKKQRKNNKKQVPITKEYRWYQIKIYDGAQPSKVFLEESFSSLIDVPFEMLGYHHSTSSTRFFLEGNHAAAHAIKALDKRMQSTNAKLMHIIMEPCSSFLLLNSEQMRTLKQVLVKRYDGASGILDLSAFHHDPDFAEANLLPVLWDPSILRQVMVVIKDNVPVLNGIVLSRNGFRLTHVRVVVGALTNFPIVAINLEQNDIDNLKELLKLLSVFPLIELKLVDNMCMADIKSPFVCFKTVRSQLPSLKTLNGDNIDAVLVLEESGGSFNSQNVSSTAIVPSENSSQASAVVTLELMHTFLKEYYMCIDTSSREKLVEAYIPTAMFTIESQVATIPSGRCQSHEGIRNALRSIPATLHSQESFKLNLVKMEPNEGQVEVEGLLQVAGVDEAVKFGHAMSIVPYNSGMGCSMSRLVFKI